MELIRTLSINTGVELLSRPTNFEVNKSKSNALSACTASAGLLLLLVLADEVVMKRTSGTSGGAEITVLNSEIYRQWWVGATLH